MNQNDELIAKLQDKLQSKKDALIWPTKTTPKTNCSFIVNGGKTVNLHTIMDVHDLLMLSGHLIKDKEAFDKAKTYFFHTNDIEFQYCGFSFEDWMDDFQMRIDKLRFTEESKKLQELEKRLLSLESDDVKKLKELEEIRKLLG